MIQKFSFACTQGHLTKINAAIRPIRWQCATCGEMDMTPTPTDSYLIGAERPFNSAIAFGASHIVRTLHNITYLESGRCVYTDSITIGDRLESPSGRPSELYIHIWDGNLDSFVYLRCAK